MKSPEEMDYMEMPDAARQLTTAELVSELRKPIALTAWQQALSNEVMVRILMGMLTK